jgi:hypothetical protein
MPVLIPLVTWLKETTFSIELSYMMNNGTSITKHMQWKTSVSLRPISACVIGPNENNDGLFFVITRTLFTLRFLKSSLGKTVTLVSCFDTASR